MGTSRFAWAVAALLLLSAAPVFADAKAEIAAKNKEAMSNYDSMEYDVAKKQLTAALAAAKKAKLDKDPVTSKIYLSLGIAAFADGDLDGAKAAFVSAVQIDAKIQIDPAYKSPDLQKLLDEAKLSVKSGSAVTEPGGGDAVDCAMVKGLQHTVLDTAPQGAAAPIEVLVGSEISPTKVAVMYRVAGAIEFTEAKLTKKGECKYTGSIPASAMKGELIHYYVAAFDSNNKVIAAKGSSGSPNILEMSAPVAGRNTSTPDDSEDPIAGKRVASSSTGSSATIEGNGGVINGGKPSKVMITLAGGTGFGYVSGNTEGGNEVEECCIGNSYVVLLPELAYMVSKKLSIGAAARIGFPIGANVNAAGSAGHSTIAPAGLLRVRYLLSQRGEGIRIMGQVGYGVMRNTIHLKTGVAGMDTDIVGQGPLLLGAGVGYVKKLGGALSFVADLSALVGIAVTDMIGSTTVNTGVGADLSLGLAVGF